MAKPPKKRKRRRTRTEAPPGTISVNEKLMRDTVRHAVNLEKFKRGQITQVERWMGSAQVKTMVGVRQRIKKLGPIEVQKFGKGLITTKRTQALSDYLNDEIDKLGEFGTRYWQLMGEKLSEAEAEFALKQLENGVPADVSFLRPARDQLHSLTKSRPFEGHPLKEHTFAWKEKLKGDIMADIRVGMIEGESTERIARAVNTRMRVSWRGSMNFARTITRTIINHVSSRAREEVYERNQDILKGVMWVSTLDNRTTEICMLRDGTVYAVGKGPRPPAHYNCRSTTVPVTKASSQLPKEIQDSRTRASMDGQVPARMTYNEWLRTMDDDPETKHRVEEALGPTKAKMWRDNGRSMTHKNGRGLFAEKTSGRIFTVEELKKRDNN